MYLRNIFIVLFSVFIAEGYSSSTIVIEDRQKNDVQEEAPSRNSGDLSSFFTQDIDNDLLIDVFPREPSDFRLVSACFGANNFAVMVREKCEDPDAKIKTLREKEIILSNNSDDDGVIANIIQSPEALGFFGYKNRPDMKNDIISYANISYKEVQDMFDYPVLNTNDQDKYKQRTNSCDLYKLFNSEFDTFKEHSKRSWRFFVADDSNNICATVGLTNIPLAFPEPTDSKGEPVSVKAPDIPGISLFIDYFVLTKYRARAFSGTGKERSNKYVGLGRRSLCETLKVIFGNKKGDTYISNAILNIRSKNLASLKIAYKSGFLSLREFENNCIEGEEYTGMNYVLSKDYYFENKDAINEGTCTISRDLLSAIGKEESSPKPSSPSRQSSPVLTENRRDSINMPAEKLQALRLSLQSSNDGYSSPKSDSNREITDFFSIKSNRGAVQFMFDDSRSSVKH